MKRIKVEFPNQTETKIPVTVKPRIPVILIPTRNQIELFSALPNSSDALFALKNEQREQERYARR
jgi:hypothetical protein